MITKAENEPVPGSGSYDCKGLHGPVCGVPTPKWRHKVRGSWNTPWDVDLSLTWRYIGKVDNEGTSSNPQLNFPVNPVDRTFNAKNYFDIAGSWTATKQLTLRGGINNVLDKDPPVSDFTTQGAGFSNGNTYPQVYDSLGRRVFLNATYKF
jgi:outer membrane receptor protein involved in Fe transport